MERAEYERMHAVEDRMWWYRGLRRMVVQMLVKAAGSNGAIGIVLDAGCGTGGMLAALAAGQVGAHIIGLEHDHVAAGLAARKSGLPVVGGSVNELPFGAATLAACVSLDVLSHRAADPHRALAEAWRCLAPGGVVVLNLPAYGWLLSAHDRRVHNVRRFARGSARALLAAHGFRVLRASYWNCLLFPLMLLHRLAGRADAASDVREFPRWLDALFGWVLALERALIVAGVSLPFGGSLIIVAVRDG